MTDFFIPDALPVLSRGDHDPGSGRACAMNAVSIITGRPWEGDKPTSVDPLLVYLFIAVNDRLGDDVRHLLWPLILRVIGTAPPACEDRTRRRRLVVALLINTALERLADERPSEHPDAVADLGVARAWYLSPGNGTQVAAYREYRPIHCHGCRLAAEARLAVVGYHADAVSGLAVALEDLATDGDLVGNLDGILTEYTRLTGRPRDTTDVPWGTLQAELGTVEV